MNIQRSSFYAWKKKLAHPSTRMKSLLSNILLFKEYHAKFPSHGYRWLNAKIRLDTGLVLSDAYAHKCCKITGIKSQAKHYKYKKPGDSYRVFPNLLMTEIQIDGPLQCIVSDMTAFYVKGIYYELTLYMDLWNNEIVSHSLSSKRGDRMTYISGLEDLIALKKQYPEYEMILHSDQGFQYTSYEYKAICESNGIQISMSRKGTPIDDSPIESWHALLKKETLYNNNITSLQEYIQLVEDWILFYNTTRLKSKIKKKRKNYTKREK